jgi:hypothetical protein
MGGCLSAKNTAEFKALGAIQRDRKNSVPDASLGHLDSAERVDFLAETRSIILGGIKLRYASISIRGHYPDSEIFLNFLSFWNSYRC